MCDEYGEHYFASDEDLWAAVESPEMATAVEEASSYLDMENTRLIVVETDIIFECSPSS